MREFEYNDAAVEVLDILNYTNQEDVRKIPQSFIKFLTEIANKNYKVNFNHNGKISGLNLRKQTKELLGFIYITWWCNDKDRDDYKNLIQSNNLKIEKIYNFDVNDIFKNEKEIKANVIENENIKETSIIEYKENNLFKRFFYKLLSFFNKKERGK